MIKKIKRASDLEIVEEAQRIGVDLSIPGISLIAPCPWKDMPLRTKRFTAMVNLRLID